MFAVPGWSLTTKIKQERNDSALSSKKRKRAAKDDEPVDTSRIGELWKQHVEIGQEDGINRLEKTDFRKGLTKKEKKRLKREIAGMNSATKDPSETQQVKGNELSRSNSTQENGLNDTSTIVSVAGLEANTKPNTDDGSKKESKKERKRKREGLNALNDTNLAAPSTKKDVRTEIMAKTPPQLTPLQASMRQKLISSRFRHLNETLYTTPSASSLELFRINPEFFTEYHEGFRRQVDAWPENPVDGFLSWIRERGPIGLRNFKDIRRKTSRKANDKIQHEHEEDASPTGPESLPRDPRMGICTIADLGCGDGKLGYELTKSNLIKKLKLNIYSYDLASSAPHITVADIRSLPSENSSIDIAIFCLALMGTNWIEFIEEAYRVLRWKGECWIAEVASRFSSPKSKRVDHSVGNRVKDTGNKNKQKLIDEDIEDQGLATKADVPQQRKTDVSAFVAVLRRRGFVLEGEPQTRNKMFVQMRFIKALPPKRGKCVQERREGKKKFIDEDIDDITVEEEAKVLKPCVYKTR